MGDRARWLGLTIGFLALVGVTCVVLFGGGVRSPTAPDRAVVRTEEEPLLSLELESASLPTADPQAARSERVPQSSEPDSEAASKALLVGRVVLPHGDSASARFAEVRVWWTYEHGVSRSGSLTTLPPVTPDSEGRFRLSGLPVDVPLVLWAVAPFALDWGRALAPFTAGERREFELALEGTVEITGRVIDRNGAPVASASLHVVPLATPGPEDRGGTSSRDRTTASTADGSFRFRRLARGEWRVAPSGTYVGGSALLVDARAGDVHGLEFVLASEACLAVCATWPDGSRVGGLQCDVQRSDMKGPRLRDDGRFEFCGLPEGALELVFESKRNRVSGIAVARVTLPDTRELDLVLHEPGVFGLAGSVRDPHGNPLTEGRVNAWSNGLSSRHARIEGGAFQFTELTEGRWSLQVEADVGWCPSRSVVVDALTAPQEFELRPATRVTGRVVDALGQLVVNAKINCDENLLHGGNVTDAAGAFMLETPPGKIRLVAEAKGFLPSQPVVLELAEGEQRHGIELALRPACTLLVRVSGASRILLPAKVSLVGLQETAETDEKGLATFDELAPGVVRVRVEMLLHEKYEEDVEVRPGAPRVIDVTLEPLAK